jgi:serine/threonine-protein kinase RsbW
MIWPFLALKSDDNPNQSGDFFMVFEISEEPSGLRIVFSSVMSNIDMADTAVRKFLAVRGLDSHSFSVCLVMREALTNAVRHGNRMDIEKMVICRIYIEDDSIVLDISDEGEGFSWKDLISADSPDHLMESGRGLAIIKFYFSSWTFNEKGNHLILRKKIGS